jgi:prepilin-type N-terminal cleavage/methylation domain-containing protein
MRKVLMSHLMKQSMNSNSQHGVRRCLFPQRIQSQRGFSLIEMAMVLVIMGLVIFGATTAIVKVSDAANIKATNDRLQQAKSALLNFVMTYGRLPCPANANSSGQASPNASGVCTAGLGNTGQAGYLPAATLGLNPLDATSNLFLGGWDDSAVVGGQYPRAIRYAVTNTDVSVLTKDAATPVTGLKIASNRTAVAASFPTGAAGNGFKICLNMACANPLAYNAAVVIWSTGKNGNQIPVNAEELQNWNQSTPRLFISHDASLTFDDHVIWISYQEIIGKLREGGHLDY